MHSACQLRITDETRQQFAAYFDDGLSPAQAISVRENQLMVSTGIMLCAIKLVSLNCFC